MQNIHYFTHIFRLHILTGPKQYIIDRKNLLRHSQAMILPTYHFHSFCKMTMSTLTLYEATKRSIVTIGIDGKLKL